MLMDSGRQLLRDRRMLLVGDAQVEDARAILEYVEEISGESDFLSFGPGEFGLSESEERDVLRKYQELENHLFILGLIEDRIITSLSFSAGHRPRNRHSGEFGMSVRQEYWGLGIGSFMLDALIEWARNRGIVRKINLRVRTDNQRAIQLYERKGFVNEGTIHKEIRLGDSYFDHHLMGLEL